MKVSLLLLFISTQTDVCLKQILFRMKKSFIKFRSNQKNLNTLIGQSRGGGASAKAPPSAGREGLPEEVLAARLPVPGGEQRAAGGGALQVHADVLGLAVAQGEPVLLQNLVLHLQEVREEQLRQRGAGHVLQTQRRVQGEEHVNPTEPGSAGTSEQPVLNTT